MLSDFALKRLTRPMWLCLIALLFSPIAGAVDLHSSEIWSIASTKLQNRWIIIHTEAKFSGIYHIEVIARGRGDPVWKIKHLANHLAITEAALNRSVLAPLKGLSYILCKRGFSVAAFYPQTGY